MEMSLSKREKKRILDQNRNRTRVNIADCFPEWRALRMSENLETDRNVCRYLLDLYNNMKSQLDQTNNFLQGTLTSAGMSEKSHILAKDLTQEIERNAESTDTADSDIDKEMSQQDSHLFEMDKPEIKHVSWLDRKDIEDCGMDESKVHLTSPDKQLTAENVNHDVVSEVGAHRIISHPRLDEITCNNHKPTTEENNIDVKQETSSMMNIDLKLNELGTWGISQDLDPAVEMQPLLDDNNKNNKEIKEKTAENNRSCVVDGFVDWSDFSDQYSENEEEKTNNKNKKRRKQKSDSEFELSLEENSTDSDTYQCSWREICDDNNDNSDKTVNDNHFEQISNDSYSHHEETYNECQKESIDIDGKKSTNCKRKNTEKQDDANQHGTQVRKHYRTRGSKIPSDDQESFESMLGITNTADTHTLSINNTSGTGSNAKSERKIQECLLCDYETLTKVNLRAHMKAVHGMEPGRITSRKNTGKKKKLKKGCTRKLRLCSACAFTCNSQNELEDHFYAMHNESGEVPPPRYSCDYCSKSYHHRKHLRIHRTKSTCARFLGNPIFSCIICGEKFWVHGDLVKHKKTEHDIHVSMKKNFKCEYCDKCYSCTIKLDMHVNSAHLKKYDYVCPHENCNKKFARKWSLTVHSRLHTDEKPLTCEYCGYSCRQKNALNWHLKSKHSVENNDS